MAKLTHLGTRGEARMVDVSDKAATERVAVAEGRVVMSRKTLELVLKGDAKKGDVLGAARIAGIMAAKKTHELIPLCHPLLLTKVAVDIEPDSELPGLRVRAIARVSGKTGVEMEALTAASVAGRSWPCWPPVTSSCRPAARSALARSSRRTGTACRQLRAPRALT